MGTSPVLPVLSFWARVQSSEASSPCFFVRISKSPFLKGRKVTSSTNQGHTDTYTHRGREAATYQGLSRGQRPSWHSGGCLLGWVGRLRCRAVGPRLP